MYDVIVLAGGGVDGDLKEVYGSLEGKAYIPLGEKLMVEYVADVLDETAGFSKKILVAPSEKTPEKLKERFDCVRAGGRGMIDSLKAGLEAAESGRVLVMPCDVPLISSDSVEDFLRRCEERQASFYYSYVRKEDSESIYPGLRHTYVRLKDGVFCGGSLVLLEKKDFHYGETLFHSLTGARKNPLRLVSLLGLPLIFGFLLRTLSVAQLEKKAGELLKAPVAAVCSAYPEMAFNVDDLSVLSKAQELLKPKGILP